MILPNIITSSPLPLLLKTDAINLTPRHHASPITKSPKQYHYTDHKNIHSQIRRKWNVVLNCSNPANITTTETEQKLDVPADSASNVVRKFYGGINARDIASVEPLIADNCVYEDLIFPHPFVGRKVCGICGLILNTHISCLLFYFYFFVLFVWMLQYVLLLAFFYILFTSLL